MCVQQPREKALWSEHKGLGAMQAVLSEDIYFSLCPAWPLPWDNANPVLAKHWREKEGACERLTGCLATCACST